MDVFNILLGVAIGTYGTLVGAGGGFLLVPLFLLVHRLPHEIAVGTSLAIVSANAFSGAIGYVWEKKIDFRAGITFALATVPGAIAGVYLTQLISGPVFMKVFGGFLIFMATYLFFRRESKVEPLHGRRGWGWVQRKTYEYFEPLGLAISLFVGVISSWLGIGGGILHVPAMTEVLRFPVSIAVATSQFVLAWTALVGALLHVQAGHWDSRLAITTGLGAILGAQLGVRLARKARGSQVLRFLALGLLAVGVRLLF